LYGFLSKFNSDGTTLAYSTFLGGNNRDYIYSIAVDNNKNAFVTGKTKSSDFPTTEGALQTTISNTKYDAFVTGINASGSAFIFSSYLGGDNDDYAYSIDLDNNMNIYVTGETKSSDFSITDGAYRSDLGDNRYTDAFICKIHPTLVETKLVEDVIPSDYNLKQNYPNPFNPRTTIEYEIRHAGFVNLQIYNVLGEEVASLVNEKQIAGSYIVNFDASSFSTGIYFYKISAGEFTSVKKMSLVK
jgi:hypothetical protein